MARPFATLLSLAARRLTVTVRAALLASAVISIVACSDPTAPEPAPESASEGVRAKMLHDAAQSVIRKEGE